jgi:hypothetical protein
MKKEAPINVLIDQQEGILNFAQWEIGGKNNLREVFTKAIYFAHPQYFLNLTHPPRFPILPPRYLSSELKGCQR